MSVQGVTFDHTKRIEYQNQTREKAILAAKEKAAVSAKTLGVELGAPLLLEEDLSASEGWPMGYNNLLSNGNARAISGESSGPMEALAPGTIPIRIRVKAAFQMLTHK